MTLRETIMAAPRYEFYSDFARKHYAEGYAEGYAEAYAEAYAAVYTEVYAEAYTEVYAEAYTEGYAKALIILLEQRGLPVDDAARARIFGCGDHDRLQVWLGRVLTARSLAEVFAD